MDLWTVRDRPPLMLDGTALAPSAGAATDDCPSLVASEGEGHVSPDMQPPTSVHESPISTPPRS
eukprot:6206068-Prymnesium_polylepis.1